mgnify:CR=1 FL=1
MRPLEAAAAAALVLAACGGGEPETGTEAETKEGNGPPHRDLIVETSIGVELGDSNYVFGTIAGVDFTEDGRLLVLDQGSKQVKIYSRDGHYLGSIGRQGSGPGEFQMPTGITVLAGGLVAVADPWAGAVKFFHPDTGYVTEITGFFPSPPRIISGAGPQTFVGLKRAADTEETMIGYTLALWGYDSEPVMEYASQLQSFDPSQIGPRLTEATIAFTADLDGTVYFSPMSVEEYRITGVDVQGDTVLTLAEDYTPVPKTDEEIRRETEDFYAFLERRAESGGGRGGAGLAGDISPGDVDFEPEPYRYAIASLGVDGDGNIWAQRGWETCPFFDVWSPSGEKLFTVSLSSEADAYRCADYTFAVGAHGLLAFEPDPEDFPEVLVISLE